LSESSHQSLLALKPRTPVTPGLALAVVLHAAVFGAALFLPQFFDRAPPLRKPIIAHMVALGKPRDPRLLPRREMPPPASSSRPSAGPVAPPAAPQTPGKALSQPAQKHPPTRQELMQRALARATGRASTESKEAPDPERAGSAQGSPEGTAQSAEEGDAYFTAVHDAILENYLVPSVISERERLFLSASVVAWIGRGGQILKHEFQKKSGNAFFDQALELAIQRTKLPPPPPDLAQSLRDTGVVLNFKP
jgi:outer membrane biosynthesis protein TonB